MKYVISALVFLAAPAALADELAFKAEQAFYQLGVTSAVTSVTNNSDKTIRFALIDCTFFDYKGKPIDIGNFIIQNMKPGETIHEKPSIVSKEPVGEVTCRPASAYYD